MNIPSTKEETDLILFDLLEGNLSKKEEEFWYDYSLKNKEFATQLELFRKIYMKDDMASYPDLSQLLRKSPWYMRLKWQLMITAGVAALGLLMFYFTTTTQTTETKGIPAVSQPGSNETIEVPEVTQLEKDSKVITKQNNTKENSTKEKPRPQQNLKQTEPAEILKNEPQQVIISQPVAVKDTVTIIKVEKVVEKIQEPQKKQEPIIEPKKETVEIKKQPSTESPKAKDKKDVPIKIKVKTSKKTKTSDFNY